MTETANLPIGLFDSGIGGLTVLKQLRKILPNEDYVYLGDTARTPYGPKGPQTIIQYSKECLGFLESQGVKLVVVACNTASSAALVELKKTCRVPVIGMIEPASGEAIKVTKGKIAVIGTRATIKSNAYQILIRDLNAKCDVLEAACPLFVPLVEEGIFDGPLVEHAIDKYLAPLKIACPDTLIMACTHYPLLREPLKRYFASEIRIIDCGEASALVVLGILNEKNICNTQTSRGDTKFFVTDEPSRFKEVAQVFLGEKDMDVTVVRDL
ncbi:MAG: glutamate racemase [bacterium]|nr:glutamate racemase [bacterium]